MANNSGPKLVEVAPERRQEIAELVAAHGVAEATRRTGLGRAAVLGIVARGTTTAGQAALLAQRGPALALRTGGRPF